MKSPGLVGFLALVLGGLLGSAPAWAEPEWVECVLSEVSVLGSHVEVSCSAVYVAENPPSLQGRQAISTELGSRGQVSTTTGGRAPSTTGQRGTRRTNEQERGTSSSSGQSRGQQANRPQVSVSSAARLPAQKDAVRVYAVAHSTPAATAILQLLIAAQQPGMRLQIKTDFADISGVALGCPERDCRLIRETRIFRAPQ